MAKAVCVVVLLAALTPGGSMWGPMTHCEMGCQGLFGETALLPCVQDVGADTLQGLFLPDALFFGSSFTSGGNCSTTLQALHDGVFAGYMVQMAQKQQPSQLNFSLSFGAHIMADSAGFANGYLSSPLLVTWLSVWPLMSSQDAFTIAQWEASGQDPSSVLSAINDLCSPISLSQAQWVASAAAYYNSINPSFPAVDASSILACSSTWSPAITSVSTEASLKQASCYEQEMTFYDRNSNGNWTTAESRFLYYSTCGSKAVSYWSSHIQSGHFTPEQAADLTTAYVLAQCP